MHKLCNTVKREIDEIVDSGITLSNLKVLGELVDILKDIENIAYWKYKMGYHDYEHIDETVDVNIHTNEDDFNMLIHDIKSINEKLKSTDSQELNNKFKSETKKLYEYSEKIKSTIKDIKLDSETMTKFNSILK